MKKLGLVGAVAALSLLPQIASANMYFALNYGQSTIGTGVSNLGGAKLDEDSDGYQFAIGAQVFKNLDLEVSYADYGEAELKGDSGDTFKFDKSDYTFNSSAKVTKSAFSLGLVGKANFNITKNFEAFAKLGVHSWESDVTLLAATGEANKSYDGVDLLYGLGMEYAVTSNTRISLGYDVATFDDEDVTFMYLGAKYLFGDMSEDE